MKIRSINFKMVLGFAYDDEEKTAKQAHPAIVVGIEGFKSLILPFTSEEAHSINYIDNINSENFSIKRNVYANTEIKNGKELFSALDRFKQDHKGDYKSINWVENHWYIGYKCFHYVEGHYAFLTKNIPYLNDGERIKMFGIDYSKVVDSDRLNKARNEKEYSDILNVEARKWKAEAICKYKNALICNKLEMFTSSNKPIKTECVNRFIFNIKDRVDLAFELDKNERIISEITTKEKIESNLKVEKFNFINRHQDKMTVSLEEKIELLIYKNEIRIEVQENKIQEIEKIIKEKTLKGENVNVEYEKIKEKKEDIEATKIKIEQYKEKLEEIKSVETSQEKIEKGTSDFKYSEYDFLENDDFGDKIE